MIRPFLKVVFYLALLVGMYVLIIRNFSKTEEPSFKPKVIEILKSVGQDNRTVIISKPDTIIVITKAEEYDRDEYSPDPDVKFVSGDKVIKKAQPRTETTIKEGLVAYYPFNGNADDASGNKNHGIVHGATLTEDRFGNPKSAYHFDGIDDKVLIKNSKLLNNNSITISIDFMLLSQRSHFSPILYKGAVTNDNNNNVKNERTFSLWITQYGELHLASADQLGQQHLNIPQGSIRPNVWYNYVGIIDRLSGLTRSYINGKLISESVVRKSNPVENSNPLYIAGTIEKNDRFTNFNGCISDIKIYNRTLKDEEILILANTNK